MAILRRRDRRAIQNTDILVIALTHGWLDDATAQARVAYAAALGKPIRVLVAPGVRLPEDAFLGLGDIKMAVGYEDERDLAQVLAWVEELKEREGGA